MGWDETTIFMMKLHSPAYLELGRGWPEAVAAGAPRWSAVPREINVGTRPSSLDKVSVGGKDVCSCAWRTEWIVQVDDGEAQVKCKRCMGFGWVEKVESVGRKY